MIIDSDALLYRAFHALPPLTTKRGEQTGAIYGFLLTMFKAVKEFNPDFIVACFDFPAPTFRHKKFKAYKGKRPPMPKELSQQVPKLKEILKVLNIPIFEKEKFEDRRISYYQDRYSWFLAITWILLALEWIL